MNEQHEKGMIPVPDELNIFGRLNLSISDDDLCADCRSLIYQPGELSVCVCPEEREPDGSWPGTMDGDGYFIKCRYWTECASGDNWLDEIAPQGPVIS